MCIQIIHHKDDFLSIRIPRIQHILDEIGPIDFGSALSDFNMTLPSKRFHFHKNIGRTIPDVFIIHQMRISRFRRNWTADFSDELYTGFIHAYDRDIFIVFKHIDIKNFFHISDKRGILVGWNLPIFAQVRL